MESQLYPLGQPAFTFAAIAAPTTTMEFSFSCFCLEQQLVRHEAHTLADPQSRSSAVKRPVVCLGVVSRSNADELILTILFFRRKAVKRKTVSTGAVAEIFILSCSTLLCLLLVSPPRLRAVPWWAVFVGAHILPNRTPRLDWELLLRGVPFFRSVLLHQVSVSRSHTHAYKGTKRNVCNRNTSEGDDD
jgi:hypothetical protein